MALFIARKASRRTFSLAIMADFISEFMRSSSDMASWCLVFGV
jgi:hypothetical protein